MGTIYSTIEVNRGELNQLAIEAAKIGLEWSERREKARLDHLSRGEVFSYENTFKKRCFPDS